MEAGPDTSIVDLHRATKTPMIVRELDGRAWHIPESKGSARPLTVGLELSVGDTIAVEGGAHAVVGDLVLAGGRRGRAHAFVREDAFRPSPARSDVPRLLGQLEQLERDVGPIGEDPLAAQPDPSTPYERAVAAEFARANLTVEAARELPEEIARQVRAVPIFLSEETCFVAMSSVSVGKLRQIMGALGRPVNPHLVDDRLIEELLDAVYRRAGG